MTAVGWRRMAGFLCALGVVAAIVLKTGADIGVNTRDALLGLFGLYMTGTTVAKVVGNRPVDS